MEPSRLLKYLPNALRNSACPKYLREHLYPILTKILHPSGIIPLEKLAIHIFQPLRVYLPKPIAIPDHLDLGSCLLQVSRRSLQKFLWILG